MRISLIAAMLSACIFARAETTPLATPLLEEKETTIECELKEAPSVGEVPVFESQKEAKATIGTYHYKLWLPKGYNSEPQRRWPCVFIMSPGGNAGFATTSERLKNGGYIVVMLVEAKNGPWAPIVGNFLAAHDDVIQRARIQEGLKFATGHSGGARGSSLFVQLRPGFSGLILQSAGASYQVKGANYNVAGIKRNQDLWVAMTMGDKDNNKVEIESVKRQLGGARFKAITFAGGHAWAPPPVFTEALDWIEHQIYVEGPARADLKPVYLQYFNARNAAYTSATDPWQKYKMASELLNFSRSRNLTLEPQIAPLLRDMQSVAQKLRNDPAVAKEALAADAQKRLESGRDHSTDAKYAADCLDLAKRYPGTEAAAKMQEEGTSFNKP